MEKRTWSLTSRDIGPGRQPYPIYRGDRRRGAAHWQPRTGPEIRVDLTNSGELLRLDIPAVLIGDFNVMPTDVDVYAPERWRDDALFRPEVREAFAELLAQRLTDAIRHFHPEHRLYIFWTYRRDSIERDAGLRIDHVLLSPLAPPWLRKAVQRQPRGWPTSDHAPVIIELDVPRRDLLT
ncbi:exodeoxyribonuclease III [Rhizobium sp. TRM96647]|nr:exodeoxyribonuclease III [Rhizobium sp. TRM96647]MCV3760973.1 exodeoxyribonuclease III [Rhizobium sp. TRM96650]